MTDFNFDRGYFEDDPKYPQEGSTRGMAVLATDPSDVAEIATYFDADWPTFGQWPAPDRPNVLWSPSSTTFQNPGNSQAALLDFIQSATSTLDIYEQQFPAASDLLQPILNGQAGVKDASSATACVRPQSRRDPLARRVQIVFYRKRQTARRCTSTPTMVVDADYRSSGLHRISQPLPQYRSRLSSWSMDTSVEEVMAVFNSDFRSATAGL